MAFVILERAGDSSGGCVHEGEGAVACLPKRMDVPECLLCDVEQFHETPRSTLVSDPAPVCVFLEHVLMGFCPIEHVRAAHQHLAQGTQCAILHLRPRARRLVTSSYTACRVEFVLPRRRLTRLCRKPRVPRWRLHKCVQSRAAGQNSSSNRSLRPK